MNKQELAAMVAEILGTMGKEPTVKGGDYKPRDPGPERKDTGFTDGDFVPDITELDLRKLLGERFYPEARTARVWNWAGLYWNFGPIIYWL